MGNLKSCKLELLAASAHGRAIHVQICIATAFYSERWRMITLTGGPFDSGAGYRDPLC